MSFIAENASLALFGLPLVGQALGLGYLLGGHFSGYEVAVFGGEFVSLRGSQIRPHVCLDVILGHALAFTVHYTKIELGVGVSLVSSLAVPVNCLLVVLGCALAILVH